MSTDLQTPVRDGGIRSINFFNGRLLSARDLTLEQSAYREADRRLGKAVGDGVAYGLEVSRVANFKNDSPAVSVKAGLAVNRRGQTLMLDTAIDIALVRTTAASANSKVFTDCEPLQTGSYVAGAGFYLLTIASAQTTSGRAMTNGLSDVTASCNTDTLVSTVQFRLVQINPSFTADELKNQNLFRNLIAYKCFGVDETAKFISEPFGKELTQWGLLDALRPTQLTDCEVPLAVLYWTDKDGLDFIDMWSVRRRLTANPHDGRWEVIAGDRTMSESEAAFFQFQEHLANIVNEHTATLPTLQADQFFKYLPGAGFLPTPNGGLDWDTFLGPYASLQPTLIDERAMRAILKRGLLAQPIEINSFKIAAKAKLKPPTPVDVFVSPDHDDFVLFARSETGRIRVFFTPPPKKLDDLSIEATRETSSESLFAIVAGNARFEFSNVAPASYLIDVDLPGFVKPAVATVKGIGGRSSDVELALNPLPRGSLSVTIMESKSPPVDISKQVQTVVATDANGDSTSGVLQGQIWLINDLLPGTYTVTVVAPGFTTVTLAGQQVVPVTPTPLVISMEKVTPKEPVPDRRLTVTATFPVRKSSVTVLLTMHDERTTSKRPSEWLQLLAATVDRAGQVWLASWAVYLADLHNVPALAQIKPTLFLDPGVALGGGREFPGGRELPIKQQRISGGGRIGSVLRQQRQPFAADGYAVFGNVAGGLVLYVPVDVG